MAIPPEPPGSESVPGSLSVRTLIPALIAGFVVRAIFVLSLGDHPHLSTTVRLQDAAAALLSGRPIAGSLAGEPLLPWLMAMAHRLDPAHDLLLAHALMIPFGLLTIALCGWLTAAIAGARAGRIAALVAAFSPSLVFASGVMHPSMLGACLVAGALLALWQMTTRPTWRWLATLGLFVGLAGFDDRTLLLPIALAGVVPIVVWARRGHRGVALAGLAGLAMVMALPAIGPPLVLTPADADTSYLASSPLEGAVRFLIPLRPAAPGELPITRPGMMVTAVLYFLPMFALMLAGLQSRRQSGTARALLALALGGFVILFALSQGRTSYRVAAEPCLIVAAAFALERTWAMWKARAGAAGSSWAGAGPVRLAAFACGLTLLAVSAAGRFIPLRNPQILTEPQLGGRRSIMPERQVYAAIRASTQDRAAYLERLTHAVSEGIVHDWDERDADRYQMRIPFHENYILNVASWVDPARFRQFEFVDYKRALARGVGLCSEHALAECGVLESRGIPTGMVDLHGHVVALARVDDRENRWWVLDPDYGVVVPHDIREVEANPNLVRPYYLAAGFPPDSVDFLVRVYGLEGNRKFSGTFGYAHLKHFLAERVSYLLIWVFPLLLMAPLLARLPRPAARFRPAASSAAIPA